MGVAPSNSFDFRTRVMRSVYNAPQRRKVIRTAGDSTMQGGLFKDVPIQRDAEVEEFFPLTFNKEPMLGLLPILGDNKVWFEYYEHLPITMTFALGIDNSVSAGLDSKEDPIGFLYRAMTPTDIFPFLYGMTATRGFYQFSEEGMDFVLNSESERFNRYLNRGVVDFVYALSERGRDMLSRKVLRMPFPMLGDSFSFDSIREVRKLPKSILDKVGEIYSKPLAYIEMIKRRALLHPFEAKIFGKKVFSGDKEHNGSFLRGKIERYFTARDINHSGVM